MSDIPGDLRFLQSHEWARLEDDGTVRVGISDHAQSQLGDLVFVELPEEDVTVDAEEACAVVESVKAASDIYAPIAGRIVAVNEELLESPERVNESPYEDGWLFAIDPDDPDSVEELMDADAYAEYLEEDD